MAQATPTAPNCLKTIQWMWQSNPNPWSKSEPAQWSHYSDLENLIIEEAFQDKQPRAILDNYYIDFKRNRQILNLDEYKQRPIKRVERKREDKHLREARFMDLPVGKGRSFGGQYGWVSPFVIEARRYLKLELDDLPSKKPNMIPMLIEKAARGIIEEGKHIGKEREAEKLAKMLREKKNAGMEEVWRCCAYLYTLESFLYKTLNAAMRLVGDQEHEQVWRSKVRTLGPFCLLLWDDPFNQKLTTKKILYRGAKLTKEQIASYEEMAKDDKVYGSFQAYTSTSRNREKAEQFGNTLFIMEVLIAFIADLSPLSEYDNEEEELVTAGVCFRVKSVKFDRKTNKHLIYLLLRQRFSSKQDNFVSNEFYNMKKSFHKILFLFDISH
ncbi:unnamed protein product [Rotaria sp. Silwood2]|nr:unnamed protein product [Rotaria sp. Silwood2]CAF2974170.1 unnamed protein product [Rotaria sp. Silwood2]CAF3381442.1 unnamed protein product [Rotaria sp. Silwood2]CAF3995748.1 unnamed protein product [Rotaria sp. Silwood2]CAF4279030.1 unnamed protein product [Rotaria sp. Silwood2]